MPPFDSIQAVTLDAGGTLIEPWPSVGKIYADMAARHGVNVPAPEILNRQFAIAWRAKKNFDYSQPAWFELVRQTFGDQAAALPEEFFPDVYQRFAEPAVWHVHEDVRPALEALSSHGLKLAVVSNWDARLRPLLTALKLESYFDQIIISCDIGFTKPSPVIFEQAVRKLGLSPAAVLHVGDRLSEDVEGARAAGLQAVLIDRRGVEHAGQTIISLRDLETYYIRNPEPRTTDGHGWHG